MSRILNRQRQLAEQGRLRLGYTVPSKTKAGKDIDRPVRSETWVLTSHSREHVEHAAALWGGTPEVWQPMGNGSRQHRVITEANAIPGILPPGDPLSQAYEMWNKGGCVRRCDGVTEQFSGSPCICLAEQGPTWFELGPKDVCSSKSRLKVLLPDMPGLGTWRMETGSFYATDEIAGMVDTLRGAVGDAVLIPVTLRIEPRTRVAGGQTKQFTVPVVELRGVNAGALLGGQAIEKRMLASGDPESAEPLALQAAKADPYSPYFEEVEQAGSLDELGDVWSRMAAEHLVGTQATPSPRAEEFLAAFKARAAKVKPTAAEPDADGVVDAELVPDEDGEVGGSNADLPDGGADADAVWAEILKAGDEQNMTLGDIEDHFSQEMGGLVSAEASAAELQSYLNKLRSAVPA